VRRDRTHGRLLVGRDPLVGKRSFADKRVWWARHYASLEASTLQRADIMLVGSGDSASLPEQR
jgi:hypothetical protein